MTMINKNPTLNTIQKQFVDRVSDSTVPQRYILIGPTGTGKKKTIAQVAKAFYKKHNKSLLVISGIRQISSWRQEFSKINIPLSPIYRDGKILFDNSATKVSSGYGYGLIVSSSRLFSGNNNLFDELMQNPPGMIIVDDLHSFRNHVSPKATKLKEIWNNEKIDIVIAESIVNDSSLKWTANNSSTQVVRWKLDQFINLNPLNLGFQNVTYKLSKREIAIQKLTEDLTNQMVGHPFHILGLSLSRQFWNGSPYFLRNLIQLFTKTVIPTKTHTPNISDEKIIELLENINSEIEQLEVDSKWECCKKLLEQLNPLKKAILIITNTKDTAEYVQSLCDDENWNTEFLDSPNNVRNLTSDIEEHQNSTGIKIATDKFNLAADLNKYRFVIHYENPHAPLSMANRLGRINRVSSKNETKEHYLIIQKDLEEQLHGFIGRMMRRFNDT